MFILVSYDISDDKRRNRVFKILKDYGQWTQYSVFECNIEKENYLRLRNRLEKVVDNKEDNIRLYLLCEKCQDKIVRIGGSKNEFGDSIFI